MLIAEAVRPQFYLASARAAVQRSYWKYVVVHINIVPYDGFVIVVLHDPNIERREDLAQIANLGRALQVQSNGLVFWQRVALPHFIIGDPPRNGRSLASPFSE